MGVCFASYIILFKRLVRERDNYLHASITDPLTGVYSFGHIMKIGEDWLKSGKEFRLMLIDVNHFKQLNDKHGHLSGNIALEQLSSLLKREAEKMHGAVGRLGGDEFIVIVPNNDNGNQLSEAIQQDLLQKPLILMNGEKYYLSLSIGETVSTNTEHDNFQSLLHTADMQMYEHKQMC
ncbi:GGDEF domain-containing protein [Metabacillus malikii]|uniref:Diguanylate cyclase (GGDEF)-like protein n=1 Tax=Metabacillus malikii TaxID=1504265 RepID=A0ABT9ZEU3_9BACI|nr:GGDEF domain-containing protein [Metabacillus malikii]MDQ0230773.1 diguanylate cyclase (GGDEF)-like protein [Metabacillus malikii]